MTKLEKSCPGNFFRASVFFSCLTWETSIKTQNVQKMFPNRAVNKNLPVSLRFGSGGPGRKPFSHRPAWPRLLTPTENSRQATSSYNERREGGGKTEEIDVSAATLPERERKKEGGGKKKSLMSFPQVFRFLCKTVNLVKFIFFAASVFYKGSFNLFLLCPVGDPHSFFFFFPSPLCSTIFSPPFCLSIPFSFLLFFFSLLLFPPPVEVSVLIMILGGIGMVEQLSPPAVCRTPHSSPLPCFNPSLL